MSEATNKTFKDVTFERGGGKIILPTTMTTMQAIEWLQIKLQQDEQKIALSVEVDAYPLEGAYALLGVLRERYGFVSLQDTPSFFGPNPPTWVGLDVSPTESVQVPWGRIAIPGFEGGFMETGVRVKPDKSVIFVINGNIKRKFEEEARAISEDVKRRVREQSVFRGKALRVRFPDPQDEGRFSVDPAYVPKIIDTSGVKESELIFPTEIDRLIRVSLFTPIEKTDACREARVPLKRGILLEGPFGCGKTLTAYVTAKKCVSNGWTFLYLERAADLAQAILLAKQYQPCAIFAEDIDRAIKGEERTEKIDAILNTIDGIEAKNSDIIVVLTTNDVTAINKAMMRPGRLDAVIPVRPPSAEAVERLIRLYGRDRLARSEDVSKAAQMLEGQIPAVIREAVERSKLASIDRGGMDMRITGSDLEYAAHSLMEQVKHMLPEIEDERSDIEKGAALLGDRLLAAALANRPRLSNGKSDHAPMEQG